MVPRHAALTAETDWEFIQTNKVMNGKVLNEFENVIATLMKTSDGIL